MKKIIIIFIILLAFFLRTFNLNWDNNYHLHPDERFLTMVGVDSSLPSSILGYFNPKESPLNPYNIGYNFFVYGTFPLTIVKMLAVLTNLNDYNSFTLLGRLVCAFLDVLVLIILYKIVEIFENKIHINNNSKYLVSFIYACLVLPIQTAHYYTVDTFAVFFLIFSFYFCLKYYFYNQFKNLLYGGLIFGFSLACKISSLLFLPLFLLFFIIKKNKKKLKNKVLLLSLSIFFLIAYFGLRIGDPRFFKNSNFFDLTLNPIFLSNIKQLVNLTNPSLDYPPSIQWFGKGFLFPIYNLIVFGIGFPVFFLFIFGLWQIFLYKKKELYFIAIWFFLSLIYLSLQPVKTMRYYLGLYPFIALISGFGFVYLQKINKKIIYLLILVLLIWPLMFLNIYGNEHSRVQANSWIKENIPQGKTIICEYWDDCLPLDNQEKYKIVSIPSFAKDTKEKWIEINTVLKDSDYIILSSNRGYGSIVPNKDKYPLMSKFYLDLFAGKLNFKLVKEFKINPSLFGREYNDDLSEEAFTVYDHPRVMIFEKQ